MSRKPDSVDIVSDELKKEDEVPFDNNDNTFQVNMIYSNQFHPKEFASCDVPFTDSLVRPKQCLPGFDMVSEQNKDDEILELKTILKHGDPSKDIQRKHLIIDDILYYLTDPDSDPVMSLYVPRHLRALIVMTMVIWVFRKHLILSDRNTFGQVCSKNYISMSQYAQLAKLGHYRKLDNPCKKQTFHLIQWPSYHFT